MTRPRSWMPPPPTQPTLFVRLAEFFLEECFPELGFGNHYAAHKSGADATSARMSSNTGRLDRYKPPMIRVGDMEYGFHR